MSGEPLPCPFCGGEALVVYWDTDAMLTWSGDGYTVQCLVECEGSRNYPLERKYGFLPRILVNEDSAEEAIAAWNQEVKKLGEQT